MNKNESATNSNDPNEFSRELILDKLTWLSSKDAGVYLGKSANAIRIMVHRGHLRPRRLGGRMYFRRTEIDRLIEFST